MKTRHFDIFERLGDGTCLWVECVNGLLETHERLSELRLIAPGEYFVYDETNGSFKEETANGEEKAS